MDLTEIKNNIEKAHTEIGEICRQGPHKRFRMTIPAQPDRDSDLIISQALKDAEDLAAAVERVETFLAEIEQHCSAERLDAPPWIAHVRAALTPEETPDGR